MNAQLINPAALLRLFLGDAGGETAAPGSLRAKVARRIREERLYRDTVTELKRLSDRELDDLGISRFDICSVARQHARNGASC